jgi:CO/xanthine dehydrogenase Mo-binding subunit
MGQGSLTALSLLTAEALRAPLSRVLHPLPNTALVPNSGPTVASRTTMIVGRILQDAARELERRMCAALGPGVRRAGDGFDLERGRRLSWRQAARALVDGEPWRVEAPYPFPEDVQWDDDRFCGDAYLTYSWGATAIELEIDLSTFVVTPREIWLAYDIGRAVHRQQAEGQLEGGTIQALGFGLFERVDLQDGRWLQDRLQTYIVPTAADAPKLHTRIVEKPFSLGPGGAKGLGELPMNGLAAAAANAVRHALGVRVAEIPITPERLLAALREAGRA